MNTILIKPTNQTDYELFVSLAKRLKVKYEEQSIEANTRSKEQVLGQLKEDYTALKNGTLKTRPFDDFLTDLKKEGLF